jgi:peroxiredoxin
MKKLLLLAALFSGFSTPILAQTGYRVGDKAIDFRLKNVDGKMISLKDYKDARGFIVVFTCNHCPYAKAYEQRIIELSRKYAPMGFPLLAINPNDPAEYPEDSYESMQARAKKMKYPFPYLTDETQEIAKTYGATKTPHVYVLKKENDELTVEYIGAIDDNDRDAEKAKEKYVENAVDQLLKGEKVSVTYTKAIGCSIKWKKAKG